MIQPKQPLAQSIIQLCKSHNIKHIVISPGSRNAPLTIGFANHDFFDCYSIVDERCAGFFGELNVPTASTFRNSKKNIENRAYQTVRKFTHLAVNLRCMSLEDSQAVLYAGGGITKDSDPEAECIEIQNKIQTIKKVL